MIIVYIVSPNIIISVNSLLSLEKICMKWLSLQPLALIVVPTSRKARDIFEVIKLFTDHKNIMQKRIRPLVLYAGGTEETESVSKLV